ncbi:MAG: hypothetical protein ACP5LQ_09365, partial [Candidatus Methanodesulfokora sp.]
PTLSVIFRASTFIKTLPLTDIKGSAIITPPHDPELGAPLAPGLSSSINVEAIERAFAVMSETASLSSLMLDILSILCLSP